MHLNIYTVNVFECIYYSKKTVNVFEHIYSKKTVNVFENIYSKKTVFQVNSGNFPEFFKIFQKDIIIMQSGPFL